jgi:ketosteroid isomerase-like protein
VGFLIGISFVAQNRAQAPAASRDQVNAAERAFAKTMADRDHAAFTTFLADDTVFWSNDTVLKGRAAVADGWRRFYNGADAPFSWAPEDVEVVGDLGFSSGPVHDPAGNRVGTFNSVWRREADGRWRILFDKGCPPCNCK